MWVLSQMKLENNNFKVMSESEIAKLKAIVERLAAESLLETKK